MELAPDNAEAHYLHALTLLHGRADGSNVDANAIETLLQRAIQLDPNLADAHFQLAALCAGRGNYDCAVRDYEAAVRLSPDQTEAHYRLAMACKQAGKEDLATAELESFKRIRARQKAGGGSSETSIAQFISVPQARRSPVLAVSDDGTPRHRADRHWASVGIRPEAPTLRGAGAPAASRRSRPRDHRFRHGGTLWRERTASWHLSLPVHLAAALFRRHSHRDYLGRSSPGEPGCGSARQDGSGQIVNCSDMMVPFFSAVRSAAVAGEDHEVRPRW